MPALLPAATAPAMHHWSDVQVTLYSRKDCHLCEEALALLEVERGRRNFAV